MAPPGFKVIIVGGGVAGLSLAIMLEHQKVDYVVLERASTLKSLGSGLTLSAQSLRVYEQIGVLDDLMTVSKPLLGCEFFDQRLQRVGSMDMSGFDKRYGYHSIFFARSELMKVLLRHVPSHKVHWGKRILSTMQNGNGAMVRVADGTTFHGDIIVGADGAYSAVRQSLYKNMAAKGLKVSSHNTQPLRFELLCVLGTTRPLGDKYPVLNEPTCKMDIVLASKEISYSVFATSVPGGRVAWAIGGHFLSERIHDQESFRQTELGSESLDGIRKVLDNVRIPLGGTIGEMIEATDNVSNILVEDKLFSVWSEGRTVLMGDAAHKLTFAGGQGANQAILDGVCLANLLHEMPTGSLEDLKRVFTKYQEIRFPPAKKCIEGSAQLSKLMSHQGRFADFLRSIALNIPLSLTHRAHDAIFTGRPILNYMDPIPLKGSKKDTSKPHKLDKPKDAVSI